MRKRGTALALLGAISIAFCPRIVQADEPVKIGVLTDMSSVYADYGGAGSVLAAKMAVADSGMADRVEVLSADTQNKADIGVATAQKWFDQGVNAIFDVPNSSVALAVNGAAGRAQKLVFFSTTINDRITEEECNGYGLAWVWDTYSVGRAEAAALMREGKDTWFVITPDGAAGIALEQTAREAAATNGAKVVGAVHHPTNQPDFASYLLQAHSSGAKAVLFGSGGGDLVNALKQAREFGLPQGGITIGTMYAINTDIQSLGLNDMQGLTVVTAFDWNRNEQTRAFGNRFFAVHKKMPTMFQAGAYSAVLQYLAAVKATGSVETDKVRAYLLSVPMNDVFLQNGKLLPNGRMLHDMFLARIKSPAQSKGDWDFFDFVGEVPGTEAFRKLSDSKCPLVK
ncbi:ABC transporter substrate-binding protein [Bradyrhizobium sp. 6(2017)]|uniref:ABC transporter substrate-binding protein n=1 Tax=Bradyrhizobium sp. 6(2017) TaxID=1197460 RepID=UPI001FEFCAD2|nr:ABC transporter substrate-binding protein [Bradyrhizobium sp. 6(2017)]